MLTDGEVEPNIDLRFRQCLSHMVAYFSFAALTFKFLPRLVLKRIPHPRTSHPRLFETELRTTSLKSQHDKNQQHLQRQTDAFLACRLNQARIQYNMADRGGAGAGAGARGGFGSRGGDRGGDRGRGRGRRGPRRGGNKSDEKEWQPVTKLGRLVKAGKIKSMEEIYLHSLPIKEYQIVDFFLPKLKDEVMKVRIHWTRIKKDPQKLLREEEYADWFPFADQASPEADPCRSTYTIQGHCCHWRL